jgi:hypothetical protein
MSIYFAKLTLKLHVPLNGDNVMEVDSSYKSPWQDQLKWIPLDIQGISAFDPNLYAK